MSVAIGWKDLKDSVVDGEESDVESAATQVEDEDVLLALLFVQTVCNGSSSAKNKTEA